MNQEKRLNKIKDEMKEVNYFIDASKDANGYICFNMRVVSHLETLRDEINSALDELSKELLIRR